MYTLIPNTVFFFTAFELNLTQYSKRAANGTDVMWNVRSSDLLLKLFTPAEVHNNHAQKHININTVRGSVSASIISTYTQMEEFVLKTMSQKSWQENSVLIWNPNKSSVSETSAVITCLKDAPSLGWGRKTQRMLTDPWSQWSSSHCRRDTASHRGTPDQSCCSHLVLSVIKCSRISQKWPFKDSKHMQAERFQFDIPLWVWRGARPLSSPRLASQSS